MRRHSQSRGQEQLSKAMGTPAAFTVWVNQPEVSIIKPGKEVIIYLYLIFLLRGSILDYKIMSEQGVYIITCDKKQNCWKIFPL